MYGWHRELLTAAQTGTGYSGRAGSSSVTDATRAGYRVQTGYAPPGAAGPSGASRSDASQCPWTVTVRTSPHVRQHWRTSVHGATPSTVFCLAPIVAHLGG